MIPHDRILLEPDGTGWALLADLAQYVPAGDFPETWLDRPCDTCFGHQYVTKMSDVTKDNRCPDCIDGRHTWTAEVGTACTKSYVTGDSEPYNIGTGCACHEPEWHACNTARGCDECAQLHPPRTVRLSVVPDMVVEIVDETDILNGVVVPDRHIIMRYDGKAWLSIDTPPNQITLPDAAKPGRFAVRVRWENVTCS